jgi:hypothetical protein
MTRKSSLTGGQVWVVRQGSRRVGHIARNAGGVLEARPGPVKRKTVCGLRFVLGNDHQGGVWRFEAEPGDNVCATCWNERAVEALDALAPPAGHGLRGIAPDTTRMPCPACRAVAVVRMGPELLEQQEDGTTHVCHPTIGGCNRGFRMACSERVDAVRPWDEGKGNSGRSVKGGKR